MKSVTKPNLKLVGASATNTETPTSAPVDAKTATSINPKQVEVNAILSSGKFILMDADGHSVIMGIENPNFIANLLDAAKNRMMLTYMESIAYTYCEELRDAVQKGTGVDLIAILNGKNGEEKESTDVTTSKSPE